MKVAVVFIVALVGIVIARPEEGTYTTKYDNVDLDQILKSERLFKNYYDCVMEKGSCTPDGTELKKHIGEGLQTKCAKCSEKQKNGSVKVIRYLIKEKRPLFDALAAKYDPQSLYKKQYKEELEQEGIVL